MTGTSANPLCLAIKFANVPAKKAAPYGALFLRLVLGYFFWAHLYHKFFNPPMGGFNGWWDALRHRYPPIVPIYVLTVEFSCAILLPLGIRTRWVALYAIPSMIAIVMFWAHTGGYWFANPGAEFPSMWLCLLVLQVIMGDGAYALGSPKPGVTKG